MTESDALRRRATIVFCDLSGYTALNEALDPEEVEQIMSRIDLYALMSERSEILQAINRTLCSMIRRAPPAG